MGIVWETYHKGVPCPWGSLKNPTDLKPPDLRPHDAWHMLRLHSQLLTVQGHQGLTTKITQAQWELWEPSFLMVINPIFKGPKI